MAKKTIQTPEETTIFDKEIDLQSTYSKAEHFIHDNKSKIITILGILGLLVLGILLFTNFYLPSQEKKAQADMFMAQQYFEQDSFKVALNGDGNYPGFEEIAAGYSFTKASKLASYYAGVCQLNLGNYESAINYLKGYSGKDAVIQAMAYGATGDALAQLNKNPEAITYYKKAAAAANNEFTSALFLLKSGGLMELENDNNGALKAYQQLKEKYPESRQAADIDKYIERVQAKL